VAEQTVQADAATIAAAKKALADHDYGKLIVERDSGPLYQLRGERTPEGTNTQIAGRLWLSDAEYFAALPETVRDLLAIIARQRRLLSKCGEALEWWRDWHDLAGDLWIPKYGLAGEATPDDAVRETDVLLAEVKDAR
jgi:hypothetical protein